MTRARGARGPGGGSSWGKGLAALATALLLAGTTPPVRDEERLREAAALRGEALAAMEAGDYPGAVSLLERLALLLPDNVLPPIDLAISHFQLGETAAAWAAIERARSLATDNPQLLFTLARLLAAAEETAAWEATLDRFARAHPRDPRPHYLRAEGLAWAGRHAEALAAAEEAVRRERDNLVLLVERLVEAAAAADGEGTLDALDAVEDRLNGFDGSLADYAGQLRAAAAGDRHDGLAPPAIVMRNLLRPTDLYRQGLLSVAGGRAPGTGMFPQLDFEPPLPKSVQGGQDLPLDFVEEPPAEGATASGWLALGGGTLERDAVVGFGADRGLDLDLDQDAIPDRLVADARGLAFRRGLAAGDFAPPRRLHEFPAAARVLAIEPLEIDHDGDLDLLVSRAGETLLYLQNPGAGTWSERARALGIAEPGNETTDAACADFDDDGDLDLLAVGPAAPARLYSNDRVEPLREVGAEWGLAAAAPARLVQVADFDLDGRLDLALAGDAGLAVLGNRGGRFEPWTLPPEAAHPATALVAADLDNDGDPDLAAATADGRAWLWRNRRESLAAEPLAVPAGAVSQLLAADLDGDGDLDLAAGRPDSPFRRWRNDGGNRNQWLRLRLAGLPDNNGKTNTQGLFVRIEARSGGDVQLVSGNGGVNHLGLGARREADVLRVVWTNGLAQTWSRVASGQTLDEEQALKGSCPFLYAWNGERFAFVTDLMWKSPLGMTLADGSPAAHASARDFVLIPGEALSAAGGELWLQVTEELWETAYLDRQRLLAVDHPAGFELVVDERFTPPPHASEPALHLLGETRPPIAAVDHEGRDVLPLLAERDGRHVDDLPLERYQGVTRGHHLDLVFDAVPAGERLRLVLWGWILPTDTSINFALAQDASRDLAPPALSLRRPDGGWEPLPIWVGFPNGKRKAVVVELGGVLPAGLVELRLATSMQIYWDAARLAVGDAPEAPRVTYLDPVAADLHFRGYSRLYRESPTGPHLFDYDTVATGPRFRDMRGRFTRFGPVAPLLAAADDLSVVMNAGDELTVRYDAGALPALPAGWHRDWVLYTDGWVKDADLHTTASQTVEPLPYHAMTAYPDRPAHRFPDSPAHRRYLVEYQTRLVDDAPFREALRRNNGQQLE